MINKVKQNYNFFDLSTQKCSNRLGNVAEMTGSGQFQHSDLPIKVIPEIVLWKWQLLFCNSPMEGYINALILAKTKQFKRNQFYNFCKPLNSDTITEKHG